MALRCYDDMRTRFLEVRKTLPPAKLSKRNRKALNIVLCEFQGRMSLEDATTLNYRIYWKPELL